MTGAGTQGSPPTEDLEDLYENAPCGYLSLQPDGRIVKVNRTLSTWIGMAVTALALRALLRKAAPEDGAAGESA